MFVVLHQLFAYTPDIHISGIILSELQKLVDSYENNIMMLVENLEFPSTICPHHLHG